MRDPSNRGAEPPFQVPRVGLVPLLLVFLRLGTMTFGGSVQSWIYREVIERRGWLDEQAFINAVGIATVLPGANPVNLSLYVGMRLRGGIGGVVAVLGMVFPAFCLILLLSAGYRDLSRFPAVHYVLAGLAASGVGVTLFTAVKVAGRLPRDAGTVAIAVAVFVASGMLRVPMLPLVAVAVPLSIAWSYRTAGQGESADA